MMMRNIYLKNDGNVIMKYKIIKLLFILGAIIFIVILVKLQLFLQIQSGKYSFSGQAIFGISQELIIAMTAGFFGPLAGFITGFLGILFGYLSLDPYVISIVFFSIISNPYSFLKYGLYGLFIGVFWKRYNFSNNIITLKSILLFCIIKIASEILFLDVITWVLDNVFLIFIKNIHMIIINRIIYTIPGFIILVIYSKIRGTPVHSTRQVSRARRRD